MRQNPAINTRHFGVQPCLKLEKIQMPPATLDAVMDALPIHATGWTRQFIGIALHLEINPPLDRVQVNVGHDPWRLQTQRGGKQSFDGNTHQGTLDSKKGLSDMIPDVNFHTKRHRAFYWGAFFSPIAIASTRFDYQPEQRLPWRRRGCGNSPNRVEPD